MAKRNKIPGEKASLSRKEKRKLRKKRCREIIYSKRIIKKARSKMPRGMSLDKALSAMKTLRVNKYNIDQFLTLSKDQLVLKEIMNYSKDEEDFNRIKNLFEDIPQKCFSDPRKDLNGWTVMQVMLLLCSLEAQQMSFSTKRPLRVIHWEFIDSPKEGAEETWKAICNIMPQTMEQAMKRVRTLTYARGLRRNRYSKLPTSAIYKKWPVICTILNKELKLKETGCQHLPMKDVYESLSPLAKTIFSVRAMDYLSKPPLKFRKGKVENKTLWKFYY